MFESVERLKVRVKAGKLLKLPLKKLMLVLNIDFKETPDDYVLRLLPNRMTINIGNRDEDEIAYIIAHGSLYFQLRHHKRGREICPKDLWPAWVLASELARSDILATYGTGSVNKKLFVRPADLNLPPRKSVEEYFNLLLLNNQTQSTGSQAEYEGDDSRQECNIFDAEEKTGTSASAPGSGDVSNEEGSEGIGGKAIGNIGGESGGENPETGESGNEEDSNINLESIIDETERSIIGAIGRGLISAHGDLQYFQEQNPDHNRVQTLRKLIMSECHSTANSSQIKRFSSPRPRRRTLDPKIKLMDTIKLGQRIAVLVDVSGSTAGYRQEIFNLMATVIRASTLVDVYIGDTEILEKHTKVRRPHQILGLPSGGGTSMDVLIRELDEKKYKSIFVITDGITPWPQEKTAARVYACLLGEFREEMAKGVPEWIRIL